MRKNDGRAIPNFINQALNNEEFTVYGDGNQTRSFCYVSDTIDGIVRLLKSDYQSPVNIGNPVEYSVLELVNKIQLNTHSNGKIIFKELPENDPKLRKPDITLAKKLLNWYPKIDLNNGLKKTIKYYSNL
jgi:dTDP-glucose 4,6-dehydratase